MSDTIIPIQSEYEKLLKEVRTLRARIIDLTAQRDDLLYHICPALQAKYDEKIGSVERELFAAQMYLKEKLRIIEILQAQINRQEEPSVKEAEKKAHDEFREYEDELKRKAEEAQRFREHWEKETQWSKHEQKRRTGKKEKDAERYGSDHAENQEEQSGGQDHIPIEGNEKNGRKESSAQGTYFEKEFYKQIGVADDVYREEYDAGQGAEEDEDPVHELKRLYRQIVKRLHPDVHPNPTEREKDLLNRASKAYKIGDLEEMRRIWEELAGTEQPEESFEDTEEGRERLRELLKKLRRRCEALEREIRHIKTSFPYTIKALLDDDKALELKRRELLDQLAEVRESLIKVDEYIAELKRQLS